MPTMSPSGCDCRYSMRSESQCRIIDWPSSGVTQITSDNAVVKTKGASLGMGEQMQMDAPKICLNSPDKADEEKKEPEPPTTFELVDQEGTPLAFERYVVDLEDGTALVAEPNLIADEYKAALRDFLTKARAKCHDASADYQLVTTDTPLEPLLRDFLTARLPKSKH